METWALPEKPCIRSVMRYSGRNLKSSASPYLNRGGAKNSRPLQKLDSMANASKPVFSIS